MASPPKSITYTTFLAESTQIVTSNNAHFRCLSFLFFFPLFISFFSIPLSLNHISITSTFLHGIIVLFLYIAAIGTITYSTQQAHYNEPFTLFSSFTSLSKSFFPLLSTTLISITCLLFLPSIAFFFSSTLAFIIILLFLIIAFHMIFTIAAVISVVESKWWFDPLRLSFALVRTMKRSSISILMLRGISIWIVPLGFSCTNFVTLNSSNYFKVLQILNNSMVWTLMMAQFVNSYTVLYLYWKDLNEESGFDVAVEMSKECISLPIDDEKLVQESNVKFFVFLAALMVTLVTFVLWMQN